MTVIQPNSVSGINSITVQNGNSLSVHKSDGSLIRTITGTTGITTFRTISVGSATTDFAQGSGINIGLGASISNGSGNTLTFGTGGDDRATIDSSGRLLVGTTTEGEASADDLTIANSGDCGITIRSGSSDKGKIFFSDATSGAGEYDGYIQYQHNDGALRFGTGGSERSRLDASGRLVVGATSSNNVGGFGGAAFQVEGLTAGTSALSLIRHSANTVGSTILMGKSRGTSDGATTVVQSGDNVARIIAYGADGTDTESSLGAIQFDVDGTPGSNDI